MRVYTSAIPALIARWQDLQAESHVSLDRVDVADNVDLAGVIHDFEEYYELRFGRRPKLTRRALADDRPIVAPPGAQSVPRHINTHEI